MRTQLIRYLTSASLLIASLQLSGCAEPTIAPASLKPLATERALRLDKPLTYHFTHGLGTHREVSLLPGVYKAAGSDDRGIWYLGTSKSLSQTVTDRGGALAFKKELVGVPRFASGGLYVPNDAAQPPRIFMIYGEDRMNAATSTTDQSATAVEIATNAQRGTPALAGGGPVAAGVGGAVAGGMVTGIIALDQMDWGKFQFCPDQPANNTEWRSSFQIVDKS